MYPCRLYNYIRQGFGRTGNHGRFGRTRFGILVIILSLFSLTAAAQDSYEHGADPFSLVFDEIPVNLVIDGVGTFSLDVIYTEDKQLFINVENLFRITGIQCTADENGNILSGYLAGNDTRYLIDYYEKKVTAGNRSFDASSKLTRQSGTLFLESEMFDEVFGIKLIFNFRALSVRLVTSFELPIVKQVRLEKVRSNLTAIRGELPADTVLNRKYHLFRAGTLDWSVSSSQEADGGVYNTAGIALGTEMLFGEAYVAALYNDRYDFDKRQLRYQWRWADNSYKVIRQAQVGKLYVPAIAYMNSSLVGASLKNTPTTTRKASGYYTISDITQPNWTVELYINDALAGYTRADAAGSYMFRIPMVYGNTSIKLKFYSPAGEERIEERTLYMPYTLLPRGEFEYNLTGGILEDSLGSRFGRAEFNVGINRMITAGAGYEYLSSIPGNPSIPFVTATFQPTSNLLVKAEYDHGVRYKGLINYYIHKGSLLELEYASYKEGQKATRFNAEKELRARLFVPFRSGNYSGFGKLSISRLDYGEFIYSTANVVISAFYKQFSAGVTAQLNRIDLLSLFGTLDAMLSYRTNNNLMIRPSLRYNATTNQLMSYKAELEKRIKRGYFTAGYERYIQYKSNYITIAFKYDLPFARTGLSVSRNQGHAIFSENAQGSIAYNGDGRSNKSFNTSTGKGGLLLCPFLDVNGNGVFDHGESRIMVSSVEITGAKPLYDTRDTVIRIPNLNNFTEYRIRFNDGDLQNIAWQFKKKIYQVVIDPNQFRRIDIPVMVVAEINGRVDLQRNDGFMGYGRIVVNIYHENSKSPVAVTITETDGSFYYLGLLPGNYYACIDSVQLHRLGLEADPPCVKFTIKASADGDIVSSLNFVLKDLKKQDNKPDSQSLLQSGRNWSPFDHGLPVIYDECYIPVVLGSDGYQSLIHRHGLPIYCAFPVTGNRETMRLSRTTGNKMTGYVNHMSVYRHKLAITDIDNCLRSKSRTS